MTSETEHEAFARLIDATREAESAARRLAILRSDRRWDRVASLFEDQRGVLYKLAETPQ